MNKFAKVLALALIVATPISLIQVAQAQAPIKTQPTAAKPIASSAKGTHKAHRSHRKHKTHQQGTSNKSLKTNSHVPNLSK
jgi:hypothetical protein